jgi:transposase InsO family protein
MNESDDLATLSLPKDWPKLVKRALILVCSMLKAAFDIEVGQRLDCTLHHSREHAAHQRLRLDHSTDHEMLRLIHARFARLDSNKRTHYTRPERLRILELKALNGWNAAETAERFLVDEDTVCRWVRELAQFGEEKLLAVEPPVNKLPQFVDRVVAQVAVALPIPTKRKIAAVLARARLHMSASAIAAKMKNSPVPANSDEAKNEKVAVKEQDSPRTVAAHYENHSWNVDFTVVPIRGGLWAALPPFAWLQQWPFCWWVAVVEDMFSRKVMGFAVFKSRPGSQDAQEFLDRVIDAVGHAPKYLVTDQDTAFTARAFKETWCERYDITPRFGAVGRYGSIAVVERFNRTLKHEGLALITIPFGLDDMRTETRLIVEHYNRYRPSQALNGRTPDEVCFDSEPANEKPRWEPRAKWPPMSGCAAPYAPVRGDCGVRLELDVALLEVRKHLPIFDLRRVA